MRYTVSPFRPAVIALDDRAWDIIPLSQILDHDGKEYLPPSLSIRLKLAATISSAIIQLHESHWLPAHSSSLSSEIFFFQRESLVLYS
jgi:hypothetical protein